MEKRLKYLGSSIVFQEVPDNISLAINISGCPYKCKGCHSEYLWKYEGNYLDEDIDCLIDEYDGLITCVCLMGGDQSPENLKKILKNIKKRGLKTCLYSGADDFNKFIKLDILPYCDYLKTGHYDFELGGLENPLSNQRFYIIGDDSSVCDITYKFKVKKGVCK